MKITRRGFRSRKYPVPTDVLVQAEQQIERLAGDDTDSVLATLRIAAYIGPGSPTGAYTLEVVGSTRRPTALYPHSTWTDVSTIVPRSR